MNIVQLVNQVDSKKLVELCKDLKIEGKDAVKLLIGLALAGGAVRLGKYSIDRLSERLNGLRFKTPNGEVIEAEFSEPNTSES